MAAAGLSSASYSPAELDSPLEEEEEEEEEEEPAQAPSEMGVKQEDHEQSCSNTSSFEILHNQDSACRLPTSPQSSLKSSPVPTESMRTPISKKYQGRFQGELAVCLIAFGCT